MRTVYRVQLAPNIAFHVAQLGALGTTDDPPYVTEVPFCNNPLHSAAPHTAGMHIAGPGVVLDFPSDTSECYVESEDR